MTHRTCHGSVVPNLEAVCWFTQPWSVMVPLQHALHRAGSLCVIYRRQASTCERFAWVMIIGLINNAKEGIVAWRPSRKRRVHRNFECGPSGRWKRNASAQHLMAIGRFLRDKRGMACLAVIGWPRRRASSRRPSGDSSAGGRRKIALLASASEGLFVAAVGVDRRADDNVVVDRAEYPSVRYTWQRLPVPAEPRTVGHGALVSAAEFRAGLDAPTRVIATSQRTRSDR